MKASEVIETLSTLSYKPGWTFEAETYREESMSLVDLILAGDSARGADVLFRVTCHTVDTNQDCALRGYDTPKVLEWKEPLRASNYSSREELLASIFGWLMMTELHESREFFRVGKDMGAPFHPHREEGNALWARVMR